ncbi:MAG: hypothetical protein ABJL54_13625 [Halioglobus sp.]
MSRKRRARPSAAQCQAYKQASGGQTYAQVKANQGAAEAERIARLAAGTIR